MKHLRIVDGNTFATSHLIKAVDAQGQEIQDFDLQECTDIKVYYEYKGNYFPVYLWSIDDQRLNIVWKGPSMRLGIYNLYIKGKFHETDWRIADWYTFEIVKYNKDAYIPEDVTILDGTYFVGADFALITLINGGGGGTPSSTLPLMDGVADVGTENAYARGDHRHPSDTNKQDVIEDLEQIRSGAEKGDTAYQKPTNGIPSTDMAQAVQTSLGKADTAFQKPANGIPLADLASGVQTSLGKADTALQTETEPLFTASAAAWITSEDITKWDNKSDFSGNYNDLTNKPTIPAAQANSDWDAVSGVAQILNKPSLATVATTGSYNDLSNKPTIPAAQVNSDWNADSGVAQILNKPSLASVATSGSYNDLSNKPTIPAAQVQANWNESDTDSKAYIQNKPTIPAAQVQSNWNESDTNSKAYIQNKPTIPAAGIPAGGNAGQVLTKTDGSTDYAVAWRDTNNIFPSAYCTTAAATAAKAASCTLWTATANSYLYILITKANSNQGALTLNVNSTGAAPIYINGSVSSSTNYTLPAGSYLVFYDGTNYYFRTDGKLTASITGTAAGTPVVNHGTSDTTFAVTPNTLHIWGEVASLTLTLATPTDATIVNEYMFEFTSGSTATTLSLPASVEWAESCGALSVEASKTYQVSIVNNIGLWTAIANS